MSLSEPHTDRVNGMGSMSMYVCMYVYMCKYVCVCIMYVLESAVALSM